MTSDESMTCDEQLPLQSTIHLQTVQRAGAHLVELSPDALGRAGAQDPVLGHVAELGVGLLGSKHLRRECALDVAQVRQALVLLGLDGRGRHLGGVRGDGAGELLDRADVEAGTLALRLGPKGVVEGLGRRELLLVALWTTREGVSAPLSLLCPVHLTVGKKDARPGQRR